MKPATRGRLEIHVAALLWGMTGLFGKWLEETPSIVIVFGRTLVGAIVLLIVVCYFRDHLRIDWRRHGLIVFLIGVLLAVHWVFFFLAVQVSTVATGLLALATIPVIVTFLEPLFFRRRLRWLDLLIGLIAVAGIALIVPAYDLSNNLTQGVVYGLLAAVTAALFTVLNKQVVEHYPALSVSFYNLAIACVVAAPWALCELAPRITDSSFGSREFLLILILGIFCTAASHALFIRGMRYVEAQFATIVGCLEPVYAILFAALLLNEIPTSRILAGGMIVLVATSVATVVSARREARSVALEL